MEAELVRELPLGDGWQYEPKWDGFRGVLENDGGELALWSRNERPLLRYFPELRPLGDLLPPHSALDGEIVIERGGRLDFDAMQMRLHPGREPHPQALGRDPGAVRRLRRPALEAEAVAQAAARGARALPRDAAVHDLARDGDATRRAGWLDGLEAAGLDGVIAKRLGLPYLPGSRDGVRQGQGAQDRRLRRRRRPLEGEADHARDAPPRPLRARTASSTTSAPAAVAAGRHDEILKRIRPLLKDAPDRGFSEPNRWGSGELAQSALKPKLVVEVRYDKVQGNRFRHGTRLIRFRDDKEPEQCTWREVREPPGPGDLTVAELLARAPRSAKRD